MDDYLEHLRKSLEQDLGLCPPEPAQVPPTPPSLIPSEPAQVPPSAPGGISLIITQEQRERLRENGFTEEEIRTMTPSQAHAHLGVK